MTTSAEVLGLIAHLERAGVQHKVTDLATPGVHSAGSYHYQAGTGGVGLAVDFAGPTPSSDSPQLLAIFAAFADVESQLAELIYSGAPYSIKNGRHAAVAYGNSATLQAHWNHVHVAIPKGTVLHSGVITMPDNPDLPNITGPVEFHPIFTSAGICTGYYIFSSKTGELHAFGSGAQYFGRSEVVG